MNEKYRLIIATTLAAISMIVLASVLWPFEDDLGNDDKKPSPGAGKKGAGIKTDGSPAKSPDKGADKKPGQTAGQGSSQDEKGADDVAVNTAKEKTGPTLKTPGAKDIEIRDDRPVSDEKSAEKVLKSIGDQQGISKGSKLAVKEKITDQYGNTLYHAQQTYKGIPILGAGTTLVVRDGKARNVFGNWSTDKIDLDVTPKYQAKEAFRMALDGRGIPDARKIEFSDTPSLAVMLFNKKARLVWVFKANLTAPVSAEYYYAVDAHKPEIAFEQEVALH